jgi:hypothetical protein
MPAGGRALYEGEQGVFSLLKVQRIRVADAERSVRVGAVQERTYPPQHKSFRKAPSNFPAFPLDSKPRGRHESAYSWKQERTQGFRLKWELQNLSGAMGTAVGRHESLAARRAS